MSNINRDLDGIYFRAQRDGKWQSICFSDLTEEEMKTVMQNKDINWVKSLAIGIGKRLKEIGDQFDLMGE